jgi:hypothetical protein
MRKITLVIAVATVGLVLGLGPAAHAQTASSIPGLPAGQGGPDNQVNPSQGGNAPSGRDNPAVDAGPATSDDDDSSLAPWLVGAAVLVVLAAGGILLARKSTDSRGSDHAGRRTAV